MKQSLLGAYAKENPLGEFDLETFGEVNKSVTIDQPIAHQKGINFRRAIGARRAPIARDFVSAKSETHQKRMMTDGNCINNEQYGDGQWIEVVPNLAPWKCSDGQWIEVTQNLSSWQYDGCQWIEVTQNLSSWQYDDCQWIEVTQNLSSWQYDDCQWIEVTQNLAQKKYGDGNCVEIVKKIPEKLGLMQARYLMALAVVGFIAVFQLLQNTQVY